ncbi:hypothetical protein ACIQU6_43410 [Streptomyces sp. NPDC090442]|uniref:hypothetical protein n=1 Tax=Streptomyces sp. NPDC090442 TaxID=3365962 RepID=UPI0037F7B769
MRDLTRRRTEIVRAAGREAQRLRDKAPYHDLGAGYFAKRDPERAMRRMVKEANNLGLTVRFDPIQAA